MPIKKNTKKKTCPLLDRDCLKEECEIYHPEFDRCMIDLLTYNLYGTMAALKQFNKRVEKD